MIVGFPPYGEYKDSGLPWIDQVPNHWEARRLAHVGRFSKGSGGSKEDAVEFGVPCVRYGDLYTTHSFFIRKSKSCVSTQRASAYTRIAYGDVLFAGSGETFEEIGKSAVNLMTSEARCGGDVILFRPRIDVHAPFLGYATDSRPAAIQKASMGRGTTIKHIYEDQLKRLVVAMPPRPEQVLIARFLDWANARLGRTIAAKQKVIAMLNEQKQAVVQRAVTRGLDPVATLKPSGVPWVGDIPEHWQILRAKYLYREVDERSNSGHEELLSVSHLTGVTPRSQKNITMFKAASYVGHKLCRPNDLVVNTMWAWAGALGVSTHAGIVSPAYAVYRPLQPNAIVGTYMDGLLRSRPYLSNIITKSTGVRASRLRLYPDQFLRLPIIQPPPEEQRQIMRMVDGETAGLHTAMSRLEREISLLREYRTRLVADVVTGKFDVRDVASRLPSDLGVFDGTDEIADRADEIGAADEEALVDD